MIDLSIVIYVSLAIVYLIIGLYIATAVSFCKILVHAVAKVFGAHPKEYDLKMNSIKIFLILLFWPFFLIGVLIVEPLVGLYEDIKFKIECRIYSDKLFSNKIV